VATFSVQHPTTLLISRLLGERLAGTQLAEYFVTT